ncbi:MAG: phosphoglucosamine mutase [bacterium]|nr:phosphoglucosamine mutase [bacterium]
MRAPTRLFGTDGIRGPAGTAPLDRASLLRLGRALGSLLSAETSSPSAIIAGDTRSSTPTISYWLSRGLEERGCRTLYGGVLPTPAVSRLAKARAADVGIAVSASHNPFPDNGVKFLDGQGFKWSRERETELERRFALEPESSESEGSETLGPAADLEPSSALAQQYISELTALFPPGALAGLSIVLDTAHGAATGLATDFFERLGATVVALGNRPDGSNINQACGSTDPESAARATANHRANIGFAFDGDADRAVAIDETGTLHDGDAMLYVLATWLLHEGRLEPPRLVATSMSNLGLETALGREGISLLRCDVGDRAVVETLRSEGLVLGGEQAGHIVHLGLSSTGDGLLVAALLAQAVSSSGKSLSSLTAGFRRFPQILRNIRVTSKPELGSLPRVMSEARRVEELLGNQGRLVLRYSGTEPLARVMIEGPDQEQIEGLAEKLAATISHEIDGIEESP